MKLEKIITLAGSNDVRRLLFLAMERSLRAVGCDVPVWVIPFDEGRFDLPKNSQWWEVKKISDWLAANNALPFLRKYQALTEGNYQFADTDVIFLKNPAKALEPHSGFVVCCNHWRDWAHTCTAESAAWMREKNTLWQKYAFNSGQFASDPALYDVPSLIERASRPDIAWTCIKSGPDQAGVNALVFASGTPVTSLTLPPYHLESSWVGDYPDNYEKYWSDESRKPYLLHWAGMPMEKERKIDELFYQYLSLKEREEFRDAYQREVVEKFRKQNKSLRGWLRRAKRSAKNAIEAWRV